VATPGWGASGVTLTKSRLATVCSLLNAADAKYVVIGGFAVALHGVVRATKDIDILIEATVDNARRVLKALQGLTWGISREVDPAEVATKPITIIGDDPRVDVLTLAWSVRYADAAPKAQRVELEGVEIPFADIDTLIRTKQTDRFQDKADVESLEQVKRLTQTR
jgi:hypothetical protein